jgi:DNA-binding CsgD family transcriptional regulator
VRTEFYNDYLRRLGMRYTFGGTIEQDASIVAYITSQRGSRTGPFGRDAAALLNTLMPHLRRGVQLHQRMALLEGAFTGVVEQLAVGVIFVDRTGAVLVMNRAAQRCVDQRDGLRLDGRHLRCEDRGQAAILRSLIHRAAMTCAGNGLSPGGLLTVRRESGLRPFSLLVSPLRVAHPVWGAKRPAACIFVTDPDAQHEPSEAVLQRLFGLTRAEAKLAVCLFQGKALDTAAAVLSLTRETVRTYLKRIFQKTATRRQAELVALLWRTTGELLKHSAEQSSFGD